MVSAYNKKAGSYRRVVSVTMIADNVGVNVERKHVTRRRVVNDDDATDTTTTFVKPRKPVVAEESTKERKTKPDDNLANAIANLGEKPKTKESHEIGILRYDEYDGIMENPTEGSGTKNDNHARIAKMCIPTPYFKKALYQVEMDKPLTAGGGNLGLILNSGSNYQRDE
nr:hypothetical protein CFP56_08083 [Quercus suber]